MNVNNKNTSIKTNSDNNVSILNTEYRADIDGLRAVAIVFVVIFHFFPSIFRGGFIGVDIFFVISGFLISKIIFTSLLAQGFSLFEFYIRRIKRLLPALIVILILCYFFGKYFLLSDEFELLGKHFVTGLGFVQNITLYLEAGYFDTSSNLKPLMHLWSLGIEEQFYLFFPGVVLIIWKRYPQYLLITLIILVLTSFLLNILLVKEYPSASFFLPITRFWELMVGSILAYILVFWSKSFRDEIWGIILSPIHNYTSLSFKVIKTHLKNLISVIGFLLIFVSFFVVHEKLLFPGWWATLPVFGAVFIISSGPETWLNRHLLSNRIVVGLGLISYPLYLWHWPMLSFAHIITSSPLTKELRISIVFISILFAWATYVLIEKPMRSNKKSRIKASVLLAISAVIIFVGLSMYSGYLKPQSEEYGVNDIVEAVGEWDHPKGLSKMLINGITVVGIDGPKKTLFIGDSNTDQYSPRVVELLKNKKKSGRGAIFLTGGGCVPIPGISAKELPWCDSLSERYMKISEDETIDRIVISALWHHYLVKKDNVERYIEGKILVTTDVGREIAFVYFDSFVNKLAKPGRDLYLILNIPIGRELDPKGMIKRDVFNGFSITNTPIVKSEFIREFKPIYEGLTKVANQNSMAIINPLDFLCGEKYCYGLDEDNKAMYKDAVHLRPSYVREKASYIDRTVID